MVVVLSTRCVCALAEFNLTEAADAFFAFQNAGYDISIASPGGDAVTCSTASINLELETVRDLLDGPGYEDIKKPKAVETINPKDFDAVVYFKAASKIEAVQQFVDAAIGFGGAAQELEDGKAASAVIEVIIHMFKLHIWQLLHVFPPPNRDNVHSIRMYTMICRYDN